MKPLQHKNRFSCGSNGYRMRFSVFFGVMLFTLASLAAQITWQFNYTDAAGTGFNDAALGAARKAALQAAASTLGGMLRHNATIKIDISSNYDNSSANANVIASAGANGYYDNGSRFLDSVPSLKIKSNYNGVSTTSDATINVNFAHAFGYSTVTSNQFDFQGILIHELTHTLGFSSFIRLDTSGNLIPSNGYTLFDSFLVDASGNPLISRDTFSFDVRKLSALTSGVYFNGANAIAENGGRPVKLFTPATWTPGSSISHIDDPNAVLYAHANYGSLNRQWNAIERAMMRDLGYNVSAIPEPSLTLLLLLGISIIFVRQKARRSLSK